MLNHSPLPWTIELCDEKEYRQIWDSNLQCVAEIYGPPEAQHEGLEKKQLEADANLICAAPRMYALLSEIVLLEPGESLVGPWLRDVENLLNDIEESQ